MSGGARRRGITVGELIAETQWIPGRDYGRVPAPTLSVTLPTFRRGADGSFRQAAASVLGQTFIDLELIIIDDASTDGTADIIAELMASDGRVSCLRHPSNIGLPAVSEFEAYRRARGQFLGFAFDDCVFEADAFEHLVAAAQANPPALIHGHLKWPDGAGGWRLLGANQRAYGALGYGNIIGNATVVLARAVIEEVGLYDPHIGLTRLCDWDLWRRIVRKFPVVEVERLVAREFGVGRNDSLGNTYPMRSEIMQEFLELDRDEALKPGRFADRDVWATPEGASYLLENHVVALQRFFASKPWARDVSAQTATESGRPRRRVIGVFSEPSASTSLCIDGLPKSDAFVVMRIEPFRTSREYCMLQLLASDIVVFSRDLFRARFDEAIALCRAHGIPHYWFVDDNFMVLADEMDELSDFTEGRLREELSTFDGVLASSEALIALVQQKLHPNARFFGPIIDPARHRNAPGGSSAAFTVASVGGGFRAESLIENVVPVLTRLAADRPVRLVARRTPELAGHLASFKAFEVALIEPLVEFDGYVRRWSSEAIDVVVHTAGNTRNLEFKTPNVLLTAAYLGAVPLVANEAVFGEMSESHGVIRVDDDAGWAVALERLTNPELRRVLVERLWQFIEQRFDATRNVATFEALAASVQPQDWVSREGRLRSVFEKSPSYVASRAPKPRVRTPDPVAPAMPAPPASLAPMLLPVAAGGRVRARQSVVATRPRLTGIRLRTPASGALVIVVAAETRPDLPLRSAAIPEAEPGVTTEVSWPEIAASDGQRFVVTLRDAAPSGRFRPRRPIGARGFVVEALRYG